MKRTLTALLLVLALVPATAASATTPGRSRVPAGFTEQRASVGGLHINYVRGGHGPTLVLLHGFPESWYMWRDVLPALAEHYTVIAPDLPGSGRSDAPATGYDKKTLAADLYGLLVQLGRQHHIRLAGHDIGTMVAYAYAAAHPGDVDKLVLSEAPIPDEEVYTYPALTARGPYLWNFGFFSLTNGLPEDLVRGREARWVQLFTDALEVNKDGIGPAEVAEFARPLRDPAHLRASFEYFRALPQDIDDNAGYARTELPMPVLAIGAAGSLGRTVPDQVERYATHVTGAVVPDSGHWLYEERPAELTALLLTFLGQR
ncbi:alpha/beta fold hydrolase [Actinoplanes sp. N902-109]|uniref:alpha/beta fold hydrolase n=1 Tax=Actinoplanes sp. (strain N902-109) TaxID=649831 RepID=UPI001E3D90C3|nr:alpha/beta hydrolase [Actinoplanes sp. N902-109]